jgi:hypothetical protein
MVGAEKRHGDPEGIPSLVRVDAQAHRTFPLFRNPRSL